MDTYKVEILSVSGDSLKLPNMDARFVDDLSFSVQRQEVFTTTDTSGNTLMINTQHVTFIRTTKND